MTDLYSIPIATCVIAFALLWPVSLRLRDASIVDYAWAPGFLAQVAIAGLLVEDLGGRGKVLVGLIGVWSIRLTVTLAGRRLRDGQEDPRYTSIRESWGKAFWWKSFFIVFLLQALLQSLIVSGAVAGIAAGSQSIGWLSAVGIIAATFGCGIAWLADHQLDRFKRDHGVDGLLTSGLRRHVRHPNYAGEILFWAGIALIGFEGGAWWALISPITIAVILIGVSGAPMLDERLGQTRTGWHAYRDRTPAFLPIPWGARNGRPQGSGISDDQ